MRSYVLLASITVQLLAVPVLKAAEPTKYVMILASVAPQDSPWSALLASFEKNVEAKSGGRIEVQLKLGGALGDEIEAVTKCRRGQIQAVGASTGALASIIPDLNLVELPYLFRSYEEIDRVLDTVVMDTMQKAFRESGLLLGFWSENGYRHFGTRGGFVKKPDDLRGKKMRTQESPVHMAMYRALGASAVPIPTTEVPQALATGNVDGFDQSALYAIAASWTKSIKYFTISEHIYQPAAIAFNASWFDALPADLQKIVLDEGRASQTKGRKAVRQIFPELVEILKSQGVEVYTLTPAERAVFEAAVKPVYADFRKTQSPRASKLLGEVEKALANQRAGK